MLRCSSVSKQRLVRGRTVVGHKPCTLLDVFFFSTFGKSGCREFSEELVLQITGCVRNETIDISYVGCGMECQMQEDGRYTGNVDGRCRIYVGEGCKAYLVVKCRVYAGVDYVIWKQMQNRFIGRISYLLVLPLLGYHMTISNINHLLGENQTR